MLMVFGHKNIMIMIFVIMMIMIILASSGQIRELTGSFAGSGQTKSRGEGRGQAIWCCIGRFVVSKIWPSYGKYKAKR